MRRDLLWSESRRVEEHVPAMAKYHPSHHPHFPLFQYDHHHHHSPFFLFLGLLLSEPHGAKRTGHCAQAMGDADDSHLASRPLLCDRGPTRFSRDLGRFHLEAPLKPSALNLGLGRAGAWHRVKDGQRFGVSGLRGHLKKAPLC